MWEADITSSGMFLDLTSSSSSRGWHTGIILEGGAIDAGKDIGETIALLLVVELRRRGPATGPGRHRAAPSGASAEVPVAQAEVAGEVPAVLEVGVLLTRTTCMLP